MDRSYGVLLAMSSLPGDFGIGTMGRGARKFVDSLVNAGARWWQMLPLTQPGPGDSPYQSVSAFAGGYYYIDFEELFDDGLLTAQELERCRDTFMPRGEVHYALQAEHKLRLLYPVFERMDESLRAEVKHFAEMNSWAGDYCRFMSDESGYEPDFFMLLQHIFSKQWDRLKEYANSRGVSIIGDMPIYVAPSGVEATYSAELFDKSGCVAGCPPDAFSAQGQHWGNPLYDWEAMKRDGYGWWIRRFDHEMSRFDLVRIDHFRGFEAYWAIPKNAKSAAEGKWLPGPGAAFFEMLKTWFGALSVIAEDLGTLTDSFHEFMSSCGFPGLKVLQFAFSPGADSAYLPHNGERNSVIYTGTHDNDTSLGWWSKLGEDERTFVNEYLGDISEKNVADRLIRAAMASVSRLCILPMQDVLGLDSSARMNVPGSAEGNWKWRMEAEDFSEEIQHRMSKMAEIYARP